MFALAGASWDHNLIAGNIFAAIHRHLSVAGACRPFTNDLKIWMPLLEKFVYPDIVVVCGAPVFHDAERDVVLNPTLVLEVLSPTTEVYDKGEKFAAYQSIGSLREYVLIPQRSRRIEQYSRLEPGSWLYSLAECDASSIHLRSVNLEIRMDEIYAGVGPGA